MAVMYSGGGGGLLGGLGGLASIAGVLTGQPWLTAAGTGLGALGGAMNGNPQSMGTLASSIGELLNGGWINPAGQNIAKTPYQATADDLAKMYQRQNPRQFGGFGQQQFDPFNDWRYQRNW